MIQRCTNPAMNRWNDWGGRGIAVCVRWSTFENFYEDMKTKPSPEYTLERINNETGGYWCGHCEECVENDWPKNCKWDTKKNQARNRRSNRMIEFDNRIQCLVAWAEEYGMSPKLLQSRLKQGWNIERALTEPSQRRS